MSEETPILEQVGREEPEFGRIFDDRELKSAKLWRATFAELLGTFTFFTIGIAVDTILHENILAVAAVWGLSLSALIFVYEEISGAHFNPATSFATFIIGKISLLRVLFFSVAQFIGALMAAGMVEATVPPAWRKVPDLYLGVTKVEAGRVGNAFLLELILTFFFIYVDFSVTENPSQPKIVKKLAAPFAIGAMLSANTLFGLHISGASMNPARSFASAVYSHYWKDHWIYWLGPLIGCVAAAVIFKAFIYGNDNKTDEFVHEQHGRKKKRVISERTF